MAKRGDEEAYRKLWEQTKNLYYFFVTRWYRGYRDRCERANVSHDDLKSLMPHAFMKTVEYFDETKGASFSTIVKYHVLRECRSLLKMWREYPQPPISLDEPVGDSDEDNESTLHDFIPDPDSERAFVVSEYFDLRTDLETALEQLSPERRDLLRAVYFDGLSVTEAAEVLGMSVSRASSVHTMALRELRSPKFRHLREYIELY